MKPIPVKDAKRIATDYGYDQVIIFARKVDKGDEKGGEHLTTFGHGDHSGIAAKIGHYLKYKVLGWVEHETKVSEGAPVGEEKKG